MTTVRKETGAVENWERGGARKGRNNFIMTDAHMCRSSSELENVIKDEVGK